MDSDIVQLLHPSAIDIQDKPQNCPRRTLRLTDRNIAQAAQHMLNAIVHSPPIILRGRWLETVEKSGNFVFHFAGNLSPQVVASYQTSLCSHFPAAEHACVVPTTGWTWVQFRGVDVAHVEGDTEIIHNGEELLRAICANLCFNDAIFCAKPHWQGNLANFRTRTAMIIAAILDTDNSICQRASSKGICMFGRQIKFVRASNSPSLVQCLRCHEVGHYYTSPKCRWTTTQCYCCGGSHDACDHDFECKKPHKEVGICDCTPKCFLCKGSGHHTREKGCPVRGDFVPLHLPKAAPAVALPAVEDAQKADAIPFTRPRARPTHRGRGKGKGRGGQASRAPKCPEGARLVEDICTHNNEELRAYCYCCPALRVDDFRFLYTPPAESTEAGHVSAKGKMAQDVFRECIIRKNRGPDFVRAGGPDIFHSMPELHEFFVKAAMQANAHLDYAPVEPLQAEAWLHNMPTDEEGGWGANALNEEICKDLSDVLPPTTMDSLSSTVADADKAIGGWKDARLNILIHLPEGQVARQTNLDGSLTTLPARREERPACEGLALDQHAGHTEHIMIINRQVQHIGWGGRNTNQFAALAEPVVPPANVDVPSEVVPNA
jgi:hypothetical protein